MAVADRAHAATNPAAWFYGKPITLEDHQAAAGSSSPCTCSTAARRPTAARPWSSPRLERARDLRTAAGGHPGRRPGVGRPAGHDDQLLPRRPRGLPEMGVVARQLWETSGLGPDDMQAADPLRPLHPVRAVPAGGARLLRGGEAKDFVRDGNIELGRRACPSTPTAASWARPTSTAPTASPKACAWSGAPRSTRWTGLEHVVVTAGTGVPTSGLILGVDR